MWTGPHQFFAVTRPVITGYGLNQSQTGSNRSYRSKMIYINYLYNLFYSTVINEQSAGVGEQDLRCSKCKMEAGGGRMNPPTCVSSKGGLGGSEQSPPLEMRDRGQVGAERTRQLVF